MLQRVRHALGRHVCPPVRLNKPNAASFSIRRPSPGPLEQSSADTGCAPPPTDSSMAPDPHRYTSGRWLDKESSRMASRHVQFDFPALLERSLKAVAGARSVLRYEKIEGGFNRAFVLSLDNGSMVVARIPFRHAGPQRLATNSEVATLSYLREYSTIPVPTVLDWSDDPSNPVGSEYIIMEHVPGVQLAKAWSRMDPIQQFDCIRGLAVHMREMTRLKFPAYGSIYFNTAPLPASQKIQLQDGYCIGPVTSPEYWPCTPEEERNYSRRAGNRGPWSDLHSYLMSLVDCGYSLVPNVDSVEQLEYRGTVSEHIDLLGQSENILAHLASHSPIIDTSSPTLIHHDYHRRNIFVSQPNLTHVSAIIDWQFTSLLPTFRYAHIDPDFLLPHDRIDNLVTAELGDSASDEERSVRAGKIAGRFELLQRGFAGAIRGWMPELWKAKTSDPVLLRFLDYCDSSWRHSATALRGPLIELFMRWSDLGLSGTCPYQLGEQDIRRHTALDRDLDEAMKLKAGLMDIIGCDSDGWVPSLHFDTAKAICHDGYLRGIQAAEESGDVHMDAVKFSQLWPFDAR